jgi:hypothetical protein
MCSALITNMYCSVPARHWFYFNLIHIVFFASNTSCYLMVSRPGNVSLRVNDGILEGGMHAWKDGGMDGLIDGGRERGRDARHLYIYIYIVYCAHMTHSSSYSDVTCV